jgi:hypothetical protein
MHRSEQPDGTPTTARELRWELHYLRRQSRRARVFAGACLLAELCLAASLWVMR